jgi:hypothetical protein
MSGSSVEAPAGLVRVLQIIVAALTAGCIIFLGVILAVSFDAAAGNSPPGFALTYMMLAVAAAMVAARVVVPRIVVAQWRRKIREGTWVAPQGNAPVFGGAVDLSTDAGKLVVVLLTRTVIAAGILEGAVFLLLAAYMLEKSPLSLAAAVVLIFALAAHIPTRSSCSAWIEDQTRLLAEERAF